MIVFTIIVVVIIGFFVFAGTDKGRDSILVPIVIFLFFLSMFVLGFFSLVRSCSKPLSHYEYYDAPRK